VHPIRWRNPKIKDALFIMGKSYPIDIKIQAVKLYNSGIGSTTIAQKLNIGKEDTILRWVYQWNQSGINGLKPKKMSKYTASFKMEVITWLVENKASHLETTNHFGLPNKSIVRQWKKKFDEYGSLGFLNRQELADLDKHKETKDEIIKRLERDNKILSAENDYLKKIEAVMKPTNKKQK